MALAVHPELWTKHRGGDECLIFRKEDFEQPENSDLLRDLNSSPNWQLRVLVELFASLFNLSPQDVPALDGNLTKITDTSSNRLTSPQSNWWSDHVERPPETVERTAEPVTPEEEPASIDPGWILESMMDEKAVEPLLFQGRVKELRIIMTGSLALVALTSFLASIPAIQSAVIATCVFGLNLVLCYVRFKRDPCQAEFEAFKKESKAFARRVREHQVLIDSISAERITLQEKLAAMESEIAGQRNRLVAYFQAEQNAAQAELDSQLKSVNQRRRDTTSSETNNLNSIQGSLGNQIADLDRRIAGLNQQEADEKARTLKALHDSHMQNYLRNHLVEDSWIPGVSATFKYRVAASGFRTAADIEYWKVRGVSGIGQVRGSALVQWRQGLESEARRSAPNLSSQQRQAIENKYRQARSAFEASKQQLQAQFNNQVADTKQYFVGVRQSLNEEEQQLRSACAQRKGQIQQDHNTEITKLDQKVIAARNQAAPRLAELSQKLQQT